MWLTISSKCIVVLLSLVTVYIACHVHIYRMWHTYRTANKFAPLLSGHFRRINSFSADVDRS